jgi:hypothetical protein
MAFAEGASTSRMYRLLGLSVCDRRDYGNCRIPLCVWGVVLGCAASTCDPVQKSLSRMQAGWLK